MKTKFPKLYKKTSTGKIQMWQIVVIDNIIHSRSGQLNGKMIPSQDVISEGKNIGRANETTPEEQAVAEAKSRWTKKKKSGYVESIQDALNDIVSKEVEGGYLPMLAHVYEKRKKDIVFPCAAQPKLDGIRGSYTGANKLWSRTRKEIIGVPHIPNYLFSLKKSFPMFDGELYKHELKDDFERIVHIVKQSKKPTEDHEIVEYHVYDLPSDKPFSERMKDLEELKSICAKMEGPCPIVVVETVICNNEEELMAYREDCLERGYEGCMARNLDGGYEYKRSKHLQKLKIMMDAEFEIVGVEEGRGKLAGHAGSFICRTKEGVDFNAKLKGKQAELKKYLNNFEDYKGKMLTVQFQGYTNKNNVPRFPVGLRIREEE